MKRKELLRDPFVAPLLPESDREVVLTSIASGAFAVLFLLLFSNFYLYIPEELLNLQPKLTEESSIEASIVDELSDDEEEEEEEEEEEKEPEPEPSKRKVSGGGEPKGAGTPDAAATAARVMVAAAHNRAAAYAGIAQSAMSEDMNKVLAQTTMLTSTGKTELGVRKGKASAGFDEGAVGGGNGGIGLGGVAGGSGGRMRGNMKGSVRSPKSNQIDWGDAGGSRSKKEIMRVVKRKTPGLRYIFNRFLRKKPGLKGKVTLRFTIAPSGKIIKIGITSSTTGLKDFDKAIMKAVKSRFKFKKIKSGNVTITVPFTFSE